MAIALVAGSFARTQVNLGTSGSFAVDVGAGDDRLLVVFLLHRGSAVTIDSVTYDGVALGDAGVDAGPQGSSVISSHIWYLLNPASGSNTLAFGYTPAGSSQLEVKAVAWSGVAQALALEQVNGAAGSSATPGASVTPGEDGELVVGCIVHESATALTAGSGETSLDDFDNGAWVTSASYAVQTTAGAQVVDWSAAGADDYALSVATFREAGGASPVTVEAGVGALQLAGQTVVVAAPIVVGAGAGGLQLLGQAAVVVSPIVVAADAGGLQVVGQTATVSVADAVVVEASVGLLQLAGQAATIVAPLVVEAGVGGLVVAGQAAVVAVSGAVIVEAAVGALQLVGVRAVVETVRYLYDLAVGDGAAYAVVLGDGVAVVVGLGDGGLYTVALSDESRA